MKKTDWAERKVLQMLDGYASVNSHHRELLREAIAKLLRAERARAVRVCRKQGYGQQAIGMTSVYIQACDDCAAAITGRKP
jgi:hypothetical protein